LAADIVVAFAVSAVKPVLASLEVELKEVSEGRNLAEALELLVRVFVEDLVNLLDVE